VTDFFSFLLKTAIYPRIDSIGVRFTTGSNCKNKLHSKSIKLFRGQREGAMPIRTRKARKTAVRNQTAAQPVKTRSWEEIRASFDWIHQSIEEDRQANREFMERINVPRSKLRGMFLARKLYIT
jgi:hypothetical protein